MYNIILFNINSIILVIYIFKFLEFIIDFIMNLKIYLLQIKIILKY